MSVASKRGCINNVLPSETLLATFKTLETKEVVKVREVCRLWLKLLDENRAFWMTVLHTEGRLEEIQSVVDQSDEKSASNLEELSFKSPPSSSYLHVSHPILFQNLTSLNVDISNSH